MTSFLHGWPLSGAKHYAQPMVFYHCGQKYSLNINHDHFITYHVSTKWKEERLRGLNQLI